MVHVRAAPTRAHERRDLRVAHHGLHRPPLLFCASALEDLRHIIENGVPKTSMVAWKAQLSEAEIQDVLAYVLILQK